MMVTNQNLNEDHPMINKTAALSFVLVIARKVTGYWELLHLAPRSGDFFPQTAGTENGPDLIPRKAPLL